LPQCPAIALIAFAGAYSDDICHSESSLAVVSWDIVNRALYLMLWVFEVLAIVGLILALTLPIQNYAFREFFQWKHHPSPDSYEAYLEKQRQERTVRLILAAPFGVMAVVLSGLLKKYRRNLR
jgi:hypothetical protein